MVWPTFSTSERELMRSHGAGRLASVPFTAVPVLRMTQLESQAFRVLLLRRLHLALPISLRYTFCRRLNDVDHDDGFQLEGAAGRIERRDDTDDSTVPNIVVVAVVPCFVQHLFWWFLAS